MLKIKIDVSKIDKARLFRGQKGVYLDAVAIETPNSEYGDYMVVQDVKKEEREAGVKGNILGNIKHVGGIGSRPNPARQAPTPPASKPSQPAPAKQERDEDVPF